MVFYNMLRDGDKIMLCYFKFEIIGLLLLFVKFCEFFYGVVMVCINLIYIVVLKVNIILIVFL